MFKLAIILAAVVVVCHGRNVYHLYTNANKENPVPLVTGGGVSFNAAHKTAILVHGFRGTYLTSLNPWIKNAIFEHANEPYNVIVVDWSVEAGYSYAVASRNVESVAKELAEFIKWLDTPDTVNIDTFHLIGFDLGAHVVGIAGRELNGRIGRITGLDPSGNGWGDTSARLRSRDAGYVEVIHTDGSGLFANGIGKAIGDIDFFANGGSNQPGCITNQCSHDRAFELFAASLQNPNLTGEPCDSNTQLNLNRCRGYPLRLGGLGRSKTGANIYRANTKRSFPF